LEDKLAHPLLDIELKTLANYEERVAYLLVAMATQLGTIDCDGLYQEAYTDGKDDKRVDLFYFDTSTGIV